MHNALQKWSKIANIDFVETRSDDADIRIKFSPGNHAPCRFRFDGPGGTLAHAFYPHDNKGRHYHVIISFKSAGCTYPRMFHSVHFLSRNWEQINNNYYQHHAYAIIHCFMLGCISRHNMYRYYECYSYSPGLKLFNSQLLLEMQALGIFIFTSRFSAIQ